MGNCHSCHRETVTDTTPRAYINISPAPVTNGTPQLPENISNNHEQPSTTSISAAQSVASQQSTPPSPTTSPRPAPISESQRPSPANDVQYKVFISHAGEDKATIATPLREKLAAHNISAFVDEQDMGAGTDAVKAMNAAMKSVQAAVIVMSPEFVARRWPMKELMCFLARCEDEQVERNPFKIIPIFYRLKVDDLQHEPMFDRRDENGKSLYDMSRFFQRMSADEPEADISKVKEALGKLREIMGVRNDEDVTNDQTDEMVRRREILLTTVCNEVVKAIRTGDNHAGTGSSSHLMDRFRKSFPSPSFGEPAVLDFDAVDEKNNPTKAEGWVKRHILDQKGESPHVVAIHGIGGVGKSMILQALAVDDDVRSFFPDGVHVMSLGADATQRKLLKEICGVLKASGAEKTEQDVARLSSSSDIDKALNEVKRWFERRRCAFLIDDVWGHMTEERVLSRLCKLGCAKSGNNVVLITTRESKVASLARSTKIVHMEPLEVRGKESRDILFFHAEHKQHDVISDTSEEAIERILDMCGGLAVGLSVAGKKVKRMKIDLQDEEKVWKMYQAQLGACASALWTEDVGSYKELFGTFETSLAFLDQKAKEDALGLKTKLTFKERHWRCCVLQKQDVASATMLMSLWETTSEDEAEKIASEFVEMGLASRTAVPGAAGKEKCFGLGLHDTVHNFAACVASRKNRAEEAHGRLLVGYSTFDRDDCIQVNGTRKWFSDELLEDGYIHRNVCRHLQGAGLESELVSLLMMPGWAAKQLNVNGILALEDDFALGLNSVQATRKYESSRKSKEIKKTLQAIWETFSMSWPFVVENGMELWFQVYGRLVGLAEELSGIQEYLERIKLEEERPCLRIKNCVLSQTGNVSTKIIPVDFETLCMVQMGDCERVACGCDDGRIVVVNVRRGEVECSWKAHDDDVLDLAIATNGSRLVSASEDKTAKVWNIYNQECVAEFAGHNRWVTAVATMGDENPSQVVTGSNDCTAQVWDMETGKVFKNPFLDHKASVECVSVLGDGDHVVTGGLDSKLRLWNRTSGTQVGEPFVGHIKDVQCVSVTPDDKRIVSGSNDCTVRIWDIEQRKQVGEALKGHTGFVQCVSVSRDGTRIASGSNDKSIRVWDENLKEVCLPLEGHTSHVTGVLFLGDRDTVVSCSSDKTIRVWNLKRTKAEKVKEKHDREEVLSLAFTSDGKQVVSGSKDNNDAIRIWDVSTGRQFGDPLRGHSNVVTGVAVVPDGERVVSVAGDRTLRVWNMHSGETLRKFTGHTDWIKCVAVAGNGHYAVTGSDDETVRVWDLMAMDGNPIVLEGHPTQAWVTSVFFSDDSKRVISVDRFNNILVWKLNTQQLIKTVTECNAMSMRRKQVLDVVGEMTAHDDAGISIPLGQRKIRYGNGVRTEVLGTLEANVTSWALSPDKRTLCVGLVDGILGFMQLEK